VKVRDKKFLKTFTSCKKIQEKILEAFK